MIRSVPRRPAIDPPRGNRRPLWVASVLLLVASGAVAQSPAPSAFTAGKAELRGYLAQKYFIEGVSVSPNEHHLWGPTQTLWIEGALTPRSVAGLQARTPDEARAIAQAFFREEATLLGLTPMSEMRELVHPRDPTGPRGDVGLVYNHYIGGLRLEATQTAIHIRPNGQIFLVMAGISPISPDLLKAVIQPGLPEREIRLVIKRDLVAAGLDPRGVEALDLEKVAVAVSPYVLWKARVAGGGGGFRVSCDYTMDAFSGQILEKMSAIRWFKAPTPEDSARVGCPATDRK